MNFILVFIDKFIFLQRFLKGDYCLESDLQPNTSPRKKVIRFHPGLHPEEESQMEFKDRSPAISGKKPPSELLPTFIWFCF